jgi:D-alanyl-D-alanine carboxypeptidase
MPAWDSCARKPGARPHGWFRAAAIALALSAIDGAPSAAQNFETRAAHAILIDAGTGTVLFQKDADSRMPPASTGKLMTSAVVFDAIESGRFRSVEQSPVLQPGQFGETDGLAIVSRKV